MNRITQRPRQTVARAADVRLMMAANAAVDRAMKKHHENNPAGYHAQRPTQARCPFNRDCPFTAGDTG